MARHSDLVAREWPSRPFRIVTGVWAVALAGLVGGTTVANLGELGVLMISLFVIPFGVLIPVWLLSLHVTVRAGGEGLRASVWPLYRVRIPYSAVRMVDTEVGDALRHHGGFVPVAGPRDDRVLGFSQASGVRISFRAVEEVRQLSILTDRAEELSQAIQGLQLQHTAGSQDDGVQPRPRQP